MKRNLLKFALLAFMLVSNFVMFAQEGTGSDTVGGDLENPDPDTPITGIKLLVLALTGIVFAYVYFVKIQKGKKAA